VREGVAPRIFVLTVVMRLYEVISHRSLQHFDLSSHLLLIVYNSLHGQVHLVYEPVHLLKRSRIYFIEDPHLVLYSPEVVDCVKEAALVLAQHVIWSVSLLERFVYEPCLLEDSSCRILVHLHQPGVIHEVVDVSLTLR